VIVRVKYIVILVMKKMVILNYIIVIFLLILSGLFSGMTLGFMSLNIFSLRRRVKLGNKQATRVYPLRKRGNLLLVTLLLGNVTVNSILAIFLGSITVGVVAAFISTGLIVIFGEILPQAVFSRHALKFGSKTTGIAWVFLIIFYPIAKPLSIILDYFLGGELPTMFSKKEFKLILREQKNLKHKNKKTEVKAHEFEILEGGLEFSTRTVKSVMTPRVNTFFIRKNAVLNKNMLKKIHKQGHSRIPIYGKTKDKIVGVLYAKDLMTINPKEDILVSKIMRKEIHIISENQKLGRVLNKFKKEKVHLFIVHGKFGGVSGIITLEDVIEEIVGEIVDEHDHRRDMRAGK
jgi:metal transporter CNNM